LIHVWENLGTNILTYIKFQHNCYAVGGEGDDHDGDHNEQGDDHVQSIVLKQDNIQGIMLATDPASLSKFSHTALDAYLMSFKKL
jgi:hypothetical protein